MRWCGTSLLVVGFLITGCGAAQDDASSSPSAESAAASTTEAEVDAVIDDGDMTATYEEATTPEAENGRRILEDAQLLEDLAASITDLFNLPNDVQLLGVECGEPNAYWSPSDQAVTICYEDADFAETVFIEAGDADPVDAALNVEVGSFYHEVGHMLIDIYDLPITGREEDVADQLAAFVMLAEDENGQVDPESVKVIRDFAAEFRAFGEEEGEVGESQFAGGHSLNQTRMYNLLCWAYGADPEGNAAMVDSGELPPERAESCEDEYAKVEYGWASLLAPYVK
ncbi:MAG: DUF4344 domain-containing metallopeptidase [Mycobacterium sp.]